MKKIFLAVVLIICFATTSVLAQYGYDSHKFEITPFVGYQFGGTLPVQGGDVRIKDAMNYGVALNIYLRPGMQIELDYLRQDTELRFKDILTGRTSSLFDMSVEYFQIGGLYETNPGRVRPYVLVSVGMTHFNPKPKDRSSEWRFSFGIGGGVKVFLSKGIGFRFQGRLLFPYFSSGGGFWCGVPGGCYVTLNGRVVVQGDVTAGIILAF